ncbi:hypothetical protein HK101_010526 [Irineochytrium annulatum]|nr:hypothetical protein HK101_010526 [Irineochytrium annulatum]
MAECLKLFNELSIMSQQLDMPFLKHVFKTFDPENDKNLASTLAHFHLRQNLEAADYRSAYHQLCDWFYGWNVTDGFEAVNGDFKMRRMPRQIDMSEKGEQLECDRIMKTFETMFTLSRRSLKKIILEIEEEIPRIGTGLSTMSNHADDVALDEGVDKEDLWRQRALSAEDEADQLLQEQIRQEEMDMEDELDDDGDDLEHFTSLERRVSRASDGLVVRRKSVAPGPRGSMSEGGATGSGPKRGNAGVGDLGTMPEEEGEHAADGEFPAGAFPPGEGVGGGDDAGGEVAEGGKASGEKTSVGGQVDGSGKGEGEVVEEPLLGPDGEEIPVPEGFASAAEARLFAAAAAEVEDAQGAADEGVKVVASRRASMMTGITSLPEGGFNMSMIKANVWMKQGNDMEDKRKILHRDINHIYSELDRSVDFLLICLANIILVMGFSELLEEQEIFVKYNTYAHEMSADFVSFTLKTIWDLLNRELPQKTTLENLRNPDRLKMCFREVMNLREVPAARVHSKMRKLHRKLILVHELLMPIDVHIFPNFVNAHKEGIKCAQFSTFDSSLWLTGGYDCLIRIHDIRASNGHICLSQYVGHKSIVTDVKFTRDDAHIVSCSFDRTIKIWNSQSSACERTLQGHTDAVTTCDVSPDGRYIASGSTDCTMRIWEFASGECVCVVRKHVRWVKSVRFSWDGKYVATAGLDFKIYLWDLRMMVNARNFAMHTRCIDAHSDYILDMVMGKPTIVITTSRDMTVRVHDYATGHEMHCISLNPSWACTVTLSPDGEYFATGSFDNNIIIFNTKDGKRVREIRTLNLGIMCVRFPRDLEYIVVGTTEGFLQQIML